MFIKNNLKKKKDILVWSKTHSVETLVDFDNGFWIRPNLLARANLPFTLMGEICLRKNYRTHVLYLPERPEKLL